MVTRIHNENEYEDLLALWSDLESGLGIILSTPQNTQEFAHRVVQYDRWMQGLMQRDPDVGLYLLFQLASNSPVGYSASHALVCAVLCHMTASILAISPKERDSLVRAALTMNISMTALQDELAHQTGKPTSAQQDAIRVHPMKSAMMLTNLGVADDTWIDIVSAHHEETDDRIALQLVPTAMRLTRILKVVDRYAAMISPRSSRVGRSAAESVRSIMASSIPKADEIGQALIRAVGLCPPGTFVRLDSDELAIVVRRSSRTNYPYVALLGKPNGEALASPRLHSTAHSAPLIRAAVPNAGVRVRVNHYQILQLGAYAAQQP